MSQHGAKTISVLLLGMALLMTMVGWSLIANQKASAKAELAVIQATKLKAEAVSVQTDIRHISNRVEYLVNRVDMLIDERRKN